jgi:hypothetical protein
LVKLRIFEKREDKGERVRLFSFFSDYFRGFAGVWGRLKYLQG